MKKHNFNAGPCVLPREAVESAIEAIRDFDNTGIGLLEISHRTPGWERIMAETEQLWRDLLNIPDNYAVMFLGGGASTQFFEVPENLLKKIADYIQTGVWENNSVNEAKLYGEVEIVASSEDKNYTYIPKGYKIPTDADYFHITTNNTIYGTEIHEDIDSPITLVADMSSDIMSRPVDVKKYGMIYGGAQKNVGPAGVTFVIIRKDLIGSSERPLQTMVNYATHYPEEARNHSMFNTPPVLPIFVMHETLKWVKAQGGVEAMYKINKKKAETLYNEIDRNSMFVGTAVKEDRSIMNVCFVMAPGHEDLEAEFMAFAKEKGMVGIKGHRSVGGFRASIYNACPQESVDALVACMQEFEKNHKK
ncbi:3-phosphoserine/phosphohydroxythreonine transaminase [Alistipes putredinis]|uniref:3-phosphoserine/phosphohydroxythreonine transaminase n=1 Tax=Alistipes putredinis TaxID=28117 RepID=UPI0040282992